MDLAQPEWLWLLLAVPLVGLLAHFAWRRRLSAAAAWAARGLWGRLLPSYRRQRLLASALLLALAVLGAALALARPRWGTSEQQVERQGIDVVFVLDTSLSMATRDVQPNRLWVGQTLVRRLVEDLAGHRVALVQAEGDGVVMAPLTADAAVIDLLLDAVEPGVLPTPGTELAAALERALALFPEEGSKHQVMILISDGEDHGSGIDQAAAKLAEHGVVVHSIGVGTLEGKPLELPPTDETSAASPGHPVPGAAGAAVEYKRDEEGNVVVSRLIEGTLEALARETGGEYLRATSAAADTAAIVERVDEMEKRTYGSEVVSALEERFQWPLALAIAALSLFLLLPPFEADKEPSP